MKIALFDAEEFLEAVGLIASEEMFKVRMTFRDKNCIISTHTVRGVLINDIKIKMLGCSDANGEYEFSYSDFESVVEAIAEDFENYGNGYALFIFNEEKNRIELVRAENRPLTIYYH
jgi:hypothetical protein